MTTKVLHPKSKTNIFIKELNATWDSFLDVAGLTRQGTVRGNTFRWEDWLHCVSVSLTAKNLAYWFCLIPLFHSNSKAAIIGKIPMRILSSIVAFIRQAWPGIWDKSKTSLPIWQEKDRTSKREFAHIHLETVSNWPRDGSKQRFHREKQHTWFMIDGRDYEIGEKLGMLWLFSARAEDERCGWLDRWMEGGSSPNSPDCVNPWLTLPMTVSMSILQIFRLIQTLVQLQIIGVWIQ